MAFLEEGNEISSSIFMGKQLDQQILSFSRKTRDLQRGGRRWSPVLEIICLALISLLCFFVRLFSVIRHESVIHEFDPYFNFRTTRYLAREGVFEFWNWFDEGSWYPLGRVIGQTLFPGLMTTAASLHAFLNYFGIIISIKDTCVFVAPIFSAFTSIAAYLLTKEVTGRGGAGLLAAIFLGLSPAYLSRSVAGSYDNEAVAIFALVFAFFTYVKALNARTMFHALLSALAYLYMVATWGGYVFITNIVSIYMVALTVLGRLKPHHYVVYCVFYVVGTMLCLNIPFVNFQAITSSEHMASHGVFVLLNAYWLGYFLKALLPQGSMKSLAKMLGLGAAIFFGVIFAWLSLTGRTQWAGRSLTLLDPTYATKYIPIIASVSEHQATIWAAYIFDINICYLLAPLGILSCFTKITDGHLFVGLYACLAAYFSGVMVRLMLVLAPAASVVSAIGLSDLLDSLTPHIRNPTSMELTAYSLKMEAKYRRQQVDNEIQYSSSEKEEKSTSCRVSPLACLMAMGFLFFVCCCYVTHGVFASAHVYSHPSIVQSQHLRDGTRFIQDDFREAYYWFRKNTNPQARLMSWWDYGYQSCTMGNRTVLVDNNTWNNTHIATVGLAFASPEEEAYPILLKLDVDYVFVVFGGMSRYSGDDINKFLWMIRIAGGIYPWIQEAKYFSNRGTYSVGRDASPALTNSLMYKLSYYRFAEASRGGFDTVRNEEIGAKDIQLKHLEEVYTTINWMVRIYQVKKPPNRQTVLPRKNVALGSASKK